VNHGLPSYVSSALDRDETLVSYTPAPDLTARRRIILALCPSFVCLASTALWAFGDGQEALAAAATVYLLVALFVFAIRLCRTSYILSTRRLMRFVGGRKVEDVKLAESSQPLLHDFAASGSIMARWAARFFSLGPTVNVRRRKPDPWTLADFITGRDRSGMRIGYPGHSLPTARILDDATRAWRAAQSAPDARVMHSGQMNAGDKSDGDLADGINRSVIRDLVETAVAIRLVCMDLLARNLRAGYGRKIAGALA
jgi:hypothetical protein